MVSLQGPARPPSLRFRHIHICACMQTHITNVHSHTYTLTHVHSSTNRFKDLNTKDDTSVPSSFTVIPGLDQLALTRQTPGPSAVTYRGQPQTLAFGQGRPDTAARKAPPAGLLRKLLLRMPAGNGSVPDLKQLVCSLSKPPPSGKKTPFLPQTLVPVMSLSVLYPDIQEPISSIVMCIFMLYVNKFMGCVLSSGHVPLAVEV